MDGGNFFSLPTFNNWVSLVMLYILLEWCVFVSEHILQRKTQEHLHFVKSDQFTKIYVRFQHQLWLRWLFLHQINTNPQTCRPHCVVTLLHFFSGHFKNIWMYVTVDSRPVCGSMSCGMVVSAPTSQLGHGPDTCLYFGVDLLWVFIQLFYFPTVERRAGYRLTNLSERLPAGVSLTPRPLTPGMDPSWTAQRRLPVLLFKMFQ